MPVDTAAQGTTLARNDADARAGGSRGPATGNTITGAGTALYEDLPTGAECTVSETDAGYATSNEISPEQPVIIGSGETVAKELVRIQDATDVDGFNLAYHITPGTFEDIVREISAHKSEPAWMLDFRLKALEVYYSKPMPTW